MPITTEPGFVPSDSAALQERLWSADPEGWALFSEPHNLPLFEAVIAAARVTDGTRILDVGCGTGMMLELATDRGGIVSGVDISAEAPGARRGTRAVRRPSPGRPAAPAV